MSQRILLVDDAPVTVAMSRKRIEEAGYIVHIATNGKEGLEEVEKFDFDLIITDVLMPVMDGVDFYNALKKNTRTNNIPIVIITDNQVFKDSFSFLGVEGFVEKPLEPSVLIAKIQELLAKSVSSKQSQKILVVGTKSLKVGQMIKLLEEEGHKVWRAESSSDFLSNCLSIAPDFILLDILMQDVPAAETIKALKCFKRFEDLLILTYSCVSPTPSQIEDNNAAEEIQETVNDCLNAGATHYIGSFSRALLVESINKHIKA